MFSYHISDCLELRLLERHHTTELFLLVEVNREHLRDWLPWVDDTLTEEDTKSFIVRSLQEFAEGNSMVCGVWDDGDLCGVIGFHNVSWRRRSAEIGYWLDRHHQGRGIITECCRAMIIYGFGTLNLNRIVIIAAVTNARSRTIPERLGFTQEGILREAMQTGLKLEDHAIYSILKREWKLE